MNVFGVAHPAGIPKGMSLVEVTVVVGVIAVLAGLAFPAVMGAREAARRLTCTTRLREVSHALHAVESATGRFPDADEWDMVDGRRSLPLTVALLSHLGQQPLYDRYAEGTAGDDGDGQPVVAVYLCPSDAAARRGAVRINTRFCTGRQATWASYYLGDVRDSGPFVSRTRWGLRPRDLPDGLSHTAAASERIGGNGAAGSGSGSDILQLDILNATAYRPLSYWQDLCRQPPAGLIRSVESFPGSRLDGLGYEHTLYNHVLPPNPPYRDCAVWGNADRIGAYAARSFHDGGVNLLAFDGSVRFTADAVDATVWQALATAAGGELEHR